MKCPIRFLLLFSVTVASCATSNTYNNFQYKKSNTKEIYRGKLNPVQGGKMVLKENGYFKFFDTRWVIFNIVQGVYIGKYTRTNDSLFLNWLCTEPQFITYYLSHKCYVDSADKSIWFIDESKNERLWNLKLKVSN